MCVCRHARKVVTDEGKAPGPPSEKGLGLTHVTKVLTLLDLIMTFSFFKDYDAAMANEGDSSSIRNRPRAYWSSQRLSL